MNLYGTEHGEILESIIEQCLNIALGDRDVSVCGLETSQSADDEIIRIELCYNSNENLNPRATITLVDVIKKAFMAIGEVRPPVVYHNLPDTIKIHA